MSKWDGPDRGSEGRAATADKEADSAMKGLIARDARLDERGKSLDERENELVAREQSLAEVADPVAGAQTSPNAFDRAYAVSKSSDVVEDISTVDEYLGDGFGVSPLGTLPAE